jgi:pSer/pThr/pTyr-binding forkhead associated (FHA) protein
MAREEAFLLFAPPEPPVRLEPGADLVLGRSRECDLPLRSSQASRRHAAVRRGPGGVVVRDLGSTNGTRVNDVPVRGERRLEPGDRIQIGDSVITLCRVEGGGRAALATDVDEAQTMVFEAPTDIRDPGALAGDLAQIPMFAVLQMLEMGAQSGVLAVHGPDGTARLWLGRGQPLHAETAKEEGLEAALALAQAQAGRFEFAPGDAAPTPSLELAMTELVLEASRRLDEEAAGA